MHPLKGLLRFALSASLAYPLPALTQSYPEKNIRLVVAYATGPSYALSLHLADKLRESFGQTFVPDFRAGAGGNLASELVAKTLPDGYTLLLTSVTISISPSLYQNLGYDTFRDFAPITLLTTTPNVLVVHPSVPAKNLAELVKLAKAHPGKLNYGSGGVGTSSQLGSELFITLNKINIVHVPYKGASVALSAILGGEVDMATSTIPATIPLINSGRIRALALLAPKRAAALPQVPTSAEAGMPEVVVATWYGLLAPAGVKPAIVQRLNAEVTKVMNTNETKNKFAQLGEDVITTTPAEFGEFIRAEYDKWGRVIKAANIHVQQ